jgi:hypothetical protein
MWNDGNKGSTSVKGKLAGTPQKTKSGGRVEAPRGGGTGDGGESDDDDLPTSDALKLGQALKTVLSSMGGNATKKGKSGGAGSRKDMDAFVQMLAKHLQSPGKNDVDGVGGSSKRNRMASNEDTEDADAVDVDDDEEDGLQAARSAKPRAKRNKVRQPTAPVCLDEITSGEIQNAARQVASCNPCKTMVSCNTCASYA